jgi:transposase
MEDTKQLYAALLGIRHPWRVVKVELDLPKNRVDVWVTEIKGLKWKCPTCEQVGPLYDHEQERSWRHLDTCQCQTFIHARLPRVNCSIHGVQQIPAPWAEPGSRFSLAFECRGIDTLKECDVTGACRLLKAGWKAIWGILERAVQRGLKRKERRIPAYLSIDEKSFAKRFKYETLVCDLKGGTVEFVVDGNRQKSLEAYYRQFTKEERGSVKGAAMDMWDPFIAATRKWLRKADIVFDRFHVVRLVSKAVDKVRRQEHKRLREQGDETLKRTRYLWLANEENIPEGRREEFAELRQINLKTSRAWALKESLRPFWDYKYAKWAKSYFDRWYYWATHSRLGPMIKAAKTLKSHLPNLLTYFKHRITNALAEGLNSKIQMVKLMACGFRNREHYKMAIYFHCGGLNLYPRMKPCVLL